MLKIRENKLWIGLLYVTIFSIGFITGKLVQIPGFVVDKNINILHALSIFVTLLVALSISVFFQKNKDINNSANEIIINRIDKIVEILDSLNEAVLEGRIGVLKAPSMSKRIYSSLKCVFKSIEDYSIPISFDFSFIENKHRIMKDLLTSTPAHNNEENSMPVKVEDDNYIYNSARISEIEKNIEEFKNILFGVQLEINKSFRTW